MITLITGTPGAGKTAWIVQELTRLPSQRKLFVHGIPDLKLPHEPVYCRSELCEHCQSIPELDNQQYFVESWHNWANDGSLLVFDEVQRIWRSNQGTTKLPESIAKLETHRHRGIDFWLASQSPKLFHNNVRALVGRHIHLISNFAGRYEYEWPECSDDLSGRTSAVKRSYKLPKQIFRLYKSSSLHTKLTHRKPIAYYVMLVTVPLVLALMTIFYKNVISKYSGDKPEIAMTSDKTGLDTADLSAGPATQHSREKAFPDFKPEIDGVPESAPAYSELIKVTSAPILAACVLSRSTNKCKCYTNQATPYPATDVYCRQIVEGNRFNPYKKESQNVPAYQSKEPDKEPYIPPSVQTYPVDTFYPSIAETS
jgi:zona occludens toxin